MKIAVVGLGKMGAQIAKRLVDGGQNVIGVDPNEASVQTAVSFGAEAAKDRADAVAKFGSEQAIVWLMIPAQYVSAEVKAWVDILPKDSILIDGGNTDFRQTKEHASLAAEHGIKLVDIGVSGGILGTKNGFSMMAGGDEESYNKIKPILDALAKPRGGYEFFAEAGSGHFVKMVHNAIEYGVMESLAEGYELLKNGPYANLNLKKAGDVWQQASIIESTLNGLAAEVMAEDPSLAQAEGYVAQSGEAKWSLEVAKQANVELPAIQAAMDVRLRSEQGTVSYTTKLLAELRNKFGGHKVNK